MSKKTFLNLSILITITILIIGFVGITYLSKSKVLDDEKRSTLDNKENKDSNIEINVESIKEYFKTGMSKKEVKEIFGEPIGIKSSETIIEGYESTEVWRYDISKEAYEIDKNSMLVSVEGLRNGYIKAQFFIEWSKNEEKLSNYGSLFYYQDEEIYRYEMSQKGFKEETIVIGVTSSYIEYNKVLSKVKESIELKFTPVPKQKMKIGQSIDNIIKIENIEVNEILSKIYFYTDTNRGKGNNEEIFASLEYKGKLYDIGLVSSYGIDSIEIETRDRNFDNKEEIEIIGKLGASYTEMKIISYNEKDQQWENILTMGSPKIVDLNEDSREELVAVSMGSNPSYVDIYLWNEDHFKKISVAEVTQSDYARLYEDEEGWIIEAKKIESEKPTVTKFYKYKEEKLIQLNYNPDRMISKPIKLPKFNGTLQKIEYDKNLKMEIPDDTWKELKGSLIKKHEDTRWKERISNLKISNLYYIESCKGIINNTEFQIDIYNLDSSYLVIVEKYGDEVRFNLFGNPHMTPFLFYGNSVNFMIQSKGTNKSFNIVTGKFEDKYPIGLFEVFLEKTIKAYQELSREEYYTGFSVLQNEVKAYNSRYIVIGE